MWHDHIANTISPRKQEAHLLTLHVLRLSRNERNQRCLVVVIWVKWLKQHFLLSGFNSFSPDRASSQSMAKVSRIEINWNTPRTRPAVDRFGQLAQATHFLSQKGGLLSATTPQRTFRHLLDVLFLRRQVTCALGKIVTLQASCFERWSRSLYWLVRRVHYEF